MYANIFQFRRLLVPGVDVVLQAFGLSRSEATLMDPQQRLLLECGADVLAQSGCTYNSSSSGDLFGVYVGVSQLEYARICLEQNVPLTAYYATGAHLSVTSGRLSYTFGMRGALRATALCAAHCGAIVFGRLQPGLRLRVMHYDATRIASPWYGRGPHRVTVVAACGRQQHSSAWSQRK